MTHGGNVYRLAELARCRPEDLLDFSANINPLGPPGWLRREISLNVSRLAEYPDPESPNLVNAAARRYGADPDEIVPGNGSTELLYALPRVPGLCRALIPAPAYVDYARASESAGLTVEHVTLSPGNGFALDFDELDKRLENPALIFLCRPNNPAGTVYPADRLRRLMDAHPDSVFVIDEAFADFSERMDRFAGDRPANAVVLLSLTKFYGVPGLRLGLALADKKIADRLKALLGPWTVNTLAQAVGAKALADTDYARKTRVMTGIYREDLVKGLTGIGDLTLFAGPANFVLCGLKRRDMDATRLFERLIKKRIAIRVCDDFVGLDKAWFRLAVRQPEENARLVEALAEVLAGRRPARRRKKTPALMIQGTGSNVGKSVLAAAFCRILVQDGYAAAPFKAQNMSNNSFVTRRGEEMGRAQAVQAQACLLDPDARMNPVLLKPNTDIGSQVVVMGEPVADMNVEEYIEYKPTAFEKIKQAYDSLAGEFDVMVLEGAGSPGEVNLKGHDVVNMPMALHAGARVLLAGDIDKGGVFASFVGTMEVLDEWERNLVAGFIVNKFRGRRELLDGALEYTRMHTGRPVLGVVPFLSDVDLPQEDSVSFKAGELDMTASDERVVEIAIIDLPHVSNFTDIDPLYREPDVYVRVVRNLGELKLPDAVIIPGTKNVPGDLEFVRLTGLGDRLIELSGPGRAEILGICGGYQMLGENIADPHGLESAGGEKPGLGLLPISTELMQQKTLTRVSVKHEPSGLDVTGYEIHHGVTSGGEGLTPIFSADAKVYGLSRPDGRVWGTYLHGLFEADLFRRWFIDRLRRRKGLKALERGHAVYDLDPALERLAQVVRECVDVKTIYDLLGF